MANYLASQFPGDYYSDDLAKSYDFAGYFNNQKQKEEAYKNQELNRKMALEDLYNEQQDAPLKRQRYTLENEGLQAGLPSIYAKAETDQRAAKVKQGIPVEDEIKATRMKLARELSDDDLKQAENAIKQALVHPSEQVRQTGKMLYENMFEIRKMREGFQSKEDIAATQAAARKAAAEEATARQLKVIEARAKQVADAARTRGPKGYQEAATRYRILAEEADDATLAQKYMSLAREFESAAQEQARASKVGGIDVGAQTGMPTTTVAPQLGSKGTPGSSPDHPIILK